MSVKCPTIFLKADMQSISEKEKKNLKKFSCAQNAPLAFVITMKHRALNSVLPLFVFSAFLGGSCSQKDNMQLKEN